MQELQIVLIGSQPGSIKRGLQYVLELAESMMRAKSKGEF